MTTFDATYDCSDDKLRLRASARLDAETYARVKAAGFGWAPKQELFYAIWSPAREDLLLELAGDIEDEETSLEDRAAQRAERFEGYSEKRAEDAQHARKAVSAIADNIPFGQPILCGHHSERHARKDAERIKNGMRKAVKMFETAAYWQERAASSIAHAKYLELPAVRARRIKTLEADQRKCQRDLAISEKYARAWGGDTIKHKDGSPTTLAERVNFLARIGAGCSYDLQGKLEKGEITPEAAQASVIAGHEAGAAQERRWISHIENRLVYERAMLAADGGTVADRNKPEKGGACKCWVARDAWLVIQKVNKVSVSVLDNWGNGGRDFTRTIPFDKLSGVMTRDEVDGARAAGRVLEAASGRGFYLKGEAPKLARAAAREETPLDIVAMKQALKAGVQVVTAPQLFPTPLALAARMVELAGIEPGDRVLEPSAGTGNILRAIVAAEVSRQEGPAPHVVAIEINQALADALPKHLAGNVVCGDFLALDFEKAGIVRFDRIIANPPFTKGSDIQHIKRMLDVLLPGGRLVSICANGPRQQEELRPLATTWEELPEGTFAEQGTNVSTALLVIDR